MPWTIERLRLAIVAAAALLLLTIAGSFFYGRWRLRRIAQDLPARLGLQIQQSTQGFVLSKTEQGRPLFTLHAARAVEFKSGGHVSLHDVRIDLYNRQDGKADTIAGNDFEYDPHSQIVEAKGEAHILLHAPATSAVRGGKDGAQVIRATTHGLVFNQKTGVATCSGEVDFQMAESSGQAMGAEYDSKQGQLRLDSQIVLTTTMQNHPAVLRASKAIYDRDESQLHLWQPRYSSGTQSGTAGAATVFLRANGSAERLDAQDRVRLASGGDMTVRAPVMRVLLNEINRPQQAHFSGGVEFTIDRPTQNSSGSSRDAEIDFDGQGRARQIALDRDVQFLQNADAGPSRLQRTLASNHLLLDLLPSKTAQSQLKAAVASGNAVFTSRSAVAGHAPEKTTLAAQSLKANFAAGNQLQQIEGAGQTRLQTIAVNGDIDSSTGDTLHIDFASGPATRPARDTIVRGRPSKSSTANENSPLATQSIQSAVQTGHVVLQQMASAKGKNASGPRISTATAARADYVAANDTLTLTGDPVFRDAQLEMTAHRMELNRATGKMVSTGAVQVTLQPDQQDSGGQPRSGTGALLAAKYPTHVIAQQATIVHDTGKAVFSGRARLWQGDDTIEAPVIEVSQKAGTLVAYGDKSCLQCVISNFTGGAVVSAQQPGPKQTAPATPSTFRVISQRLVYSDAERKASFLHHVQVFSSSGVLFANDADIFLSPANRPEKAKNSAARRNSGPQSSVTRIVATGDVRLLQPGRSATGTRLVYTQEDGRFVLTGDEKNLPEVIDLDRGTVTGQVLTFASREQAIMVSGAPGHTTTTKTRVQKK